MWRVHDYPDVSEHTEYHSLPAVATDGTSVGYKVRDPPVQNGFHTPAVGRNEQFAVGRHLVHHATNCLLAVQAVGDGHEQRRALAPGTQIAVSRE